MDLQLADRVYVVTGGSRGLGRAGAEALAAEGARLVVSARSANAVAEAAAALGGTGRATGVVADLGADDTGARLVEAATTTYGRLDGALISVGGPPPGEPTGVPDEQWRAAFETVFLGALRVVRAVVAAVPDHDGSLLLVLSTSAKSPIPGLAISNGLRPGLGMLVKDLADELGPRGVRVNALLPGRIATDRTVSLDAGDPAARQRREAAIPLRRYGRPAELGALAAVLLSPVTSYLTGSLIPVDGGALRAL